MKRTRNGISFRCPGCGDMHCVPTEGPTAWGWNGSLIRPTIAPSIKIRTGHHASHWKPGDECWCGKDYGFACYVCHSVVTDGKIMFCPDSTHTLSGKTLALQSEDE